MAVDPSETENALNAYLSLLKSKGAGTSLVNLRKHFLRHVLSSLEAQHDKHLADVDAGFRAAVDSTLARFPDLQHIEILTCSREFYPFWIGDMRTITRMYSADALTIEPANLDYRPDLFGMFEKMDADPWSKELPDCLVEYLEILKRNGADDAVIDLRERMLMLMLYIIRRAEPVPNVYRAGVEAILHMFGRDEAKSAFIEVAREFFYYWIGQTTIPSVGI